jgi:PAS domain S-box-containing protein
LQERFVQRGFSSSGAGAGVASMSAGSLRLTFQPPPAEILMFAGDGLMAADADGRILLCNHAAEAIFGYAANEIVGRPLGTLIAEPRQARGQPAHRSVPERAPALTALVQRWRTAGQRKDGTAFPVEATLSRGEIEGRMMMIAVVRDATEREAERLLLSELQHRMKNALATVRALAVQTMRSSPAPAAFIDAFSGRLAALARAHSLLMQHHQDGVSLHELVSLQLAPYRSTEPERVSVTGAAITLPPAAALALNLVLHELTTNAVKYGSLSMPAGRIEVRWRLKGSVDAQRLVLTWAETGGPDTRAPERHGFGCQLIERSVAHELDGMVQLEFLPGGVRCRIEIPLQPGPSSEDGARGDFGCEPSASPRHHPLGE